MNNNSFYMPKYKFEFIDFLVKRKGWKVWRLKKKSIDELCKIYCDERRENG